MSCFLALAPRLDAAGAENPPLIVTGVTINGNPIPFESGGTLRLPALANTVAFAYGLSASVSNPPLRLRCQLDGHEPIWRERTDKMRLLIRFEDQALNEVGVKEFSVTGESPGWTGSFSNAPYVHRREVVTVPTNSTRFWLVMSSAGPASAVGVYGIKNLKLTSTAPDAPVRKLITTMDSAPPDLQRSKRRKVAGWVPSGLREGFAQVVESGPEREITLVLVDDSPDSHGDWITPKNPGLGVQPGEQLIFEWDECHSIGLANQGNVTYENLSAGLYRFRMGGLSVMGVPDDIEISVPVEVPLAFWQTGWFWAATLVALCGLAAGAWRFSEWRRIKLQLASVEKTRLVELERFRIAQDIHDDLGARVTQISLLSSAAQKKPGITAEAQTDFAAVTQLSRNLVEALYETVWAVSPENDHLDSLVTYICQVANQMCAPAGLKCRLQIPDLPAELPVTSGVRHNLVMAIKEAIHNVIKHAAATEVQISIKFEAGLLTIEVADNGKGFDPAAKLRGNGLPNMNRRMETIGGRWLQTSAPGAGTTVRLELALADIPNLVNPRATKS